MKIDIQIPDITQDQIIEAMAARLLADPYEHDDSDPDNPDPTPRFTWDRKRVGHHLRQYFEGKIKETVDAMVSQAFGQAIRDTIAAQVRVTMDEGYQPVDERGRPSGARRTLQTMVLDALTMTVHESYSSSRPATLAQRVASDVIEKEIRGKFGTEMETAQRKFREQVDALIQAKFTETIKAALGLR